MLRVLVVVVLLTSARVAVADDTAPPQNDARAEAERLLAEGERLFVEDADYPAALELFWRSYRVSPSARALNGVAVAQQMQGRYVEAFEALDRLVTEFGSERSAAALAELNERLAALRRRIGVVTIIAPQPGARVLVDGQAVGVGPVRHVARVMPGAHTVVATLPAHDPLTRTVSVPAGGSVTVDIALRATTVALVRPIKPWVPWVTVTAGAIAASAGAFTWASASRDFERAKDLVREMPNPGQRPVQYEGLDPYRRAETKRAVAIAVAATGAAAIASGLVLAILNQPRPLLEHRGPRIVPTGRGVSLAIPF